MISKIHIENFRSIKKLTLDVTQLSAFIGPNSVGKTNVMRALEILLGETYPTERAFTKDDFYMRNSEQEIVIQVWFDQPLEGCFLSGVGTKEKMVCEAISLRLTHSKKDGSNTSLIAIDQTELEYYASGKVRDQVCLIYIPSNRSLDKQLTASQWTLLGKILKKIDENFRKKADGEEKSELELQFIEAMQKPREILESEFSGDLTYKVFKETFIEICSQNSKGLAQGFELELQIYDPLFYYKAIQIIAKEKSMGDFNVNELGAGAQNLVLLSLFRTYAILMKGTTVLAIEEPEIYLYPQAQRLLYRNFRELAYPTTKDIPPTQIFYTTHSPNFICAPEYEEIVMLEKKKSTEHKKRGKALVSEEREELKLLTEFTPERNELFFADKVVLVEGDTEKHALPYIFKTLEYRTEDNNISIIAANGKDKLKFLIKVCQACNIDWVALYDTDTNVKQMIEIEEKQTTPDVDKLKKLKDFDKANDTLNAALSSLDAQRVIPMEHNFPHVLGLSNHRNKWREIKEAREYCAGLAEEKIPQVFKDIVKILYPTPDPDTTKEEVKKSTTIAVTETSLEEIPF